MNDERLRPIDEQEFREKNALDSKKRRLKELTSWSNLQLHKKYSRNEKKNLSKINKNESYLELTERK
jgi:hypothetical protein